MLQTFIIFLVQILVLVPPLIFYTGAADHFLIKDTITQTLVFFIAVITLILILEKRKELVTGKLFWPITFFLFAGLVSLVNSTHKFLSLRVWLMFLTYSLIYFLTINFFTDKKRQNKIIKTIFITATIIAIYGLLQYFGIDLVVWQNEFEHRPSSSFGNPNFLAGYLVVVLPIMLGQLFLSVSPTSSVKTTAKMLIGIQIVLVFVCLIMTQTRGSWLAFLISFLVFGFGVLYLGMAKNNKILPYIIITFLIVILVLLPQIWSRTKTFFDINNSSVVERVFKWQTAWEMVKDYPLTGVGLGNLKVKYALYQAKVKDQARFTLRGTSESNVHNDYLQILAETGIIGIVSYVLIFGLFFGNSIKNLLSKTSEQRIFPISLISGITGFMIYSLSNFPLAISPTATLLFLWLGLAEMESDDKNVILETGKSVKKSKNSSNPNWGLRVVIGIIYIIILGVFVFPPLIAEMYRYKAAVYQSDRLYNNAVEYYEKAINTDFYRSEFTAYYLGMLYVSINDYDKAIESFKKSIALRNYGEVYNDLANCYYLKGMVKEAITNWEIALHLGLPNPEDKTIVERNLERVKKIF